MMREDWVVEKLGNFAFYKKGKKPRKQKKEPDEVFKFPYIDIEAFEKGIFNSYTDGDKCNSCSEDDFLMVWDGSRSGLVGKGVSGALGSTLMRINFPGIDNDYAFFFLKSKYVEINTRPKGTGTPHVDPNLLWSYDFPIAPLPEQRAIVAKIEQLFSELDNGIANLKKAKEKLEIYRQAVLKKAFEGELTNTNDIEWVTLGEVCTDVEYGTSTKSDNEGIVPVLRMGNIQNGQINWEDLKFTSSREEIKKYRLNKDDVLFNRTNSPEHVGKTAIFKGERESIFAGYLIRINYDKNMVNGHYLNYFLNSHMAKKYGNKVKSFGVNQSNINGTKLKSYPFPKTPLEEQAKIVQEIETRLSVCDNILTNIDEGLKKAEALRQSILKKAFEGRLLSESELEACSKESDWQPASKLLERIKKTRNEEAKNE